MKKVVEHVLAIAFTTPQYLGSILDREIIPDA